MLAGWLREGRDLRTKYTQVSGPAPAPARAPPLRPHHAPGAEIFVLCLFWPGPPASPKNTYVYTPPLGSFYCPALSLLPVSPSVPTHTLGSLCCQGLD